MKRSTKLFVLALLCLMLFLVSGIQAAPGDSSLLLVIQNGGTTIGTFKKYVVLNFSSGCTASGTTINCTMGGGGGVANQSSNGSTANSFKRFTDTAPTGCMLQLQNAAGSQLFCVVDVNGNIAGNSMTFGSLVLAGANSGSVTMAAPADGPTQTQTKYCEPTDPTQFCAVEEFAASGVGNGSLGWLGWGVGGTGSALANYQLASVSPNLGTIRVTTGSTVASDLESVFLDGSNAISPIGVLGGKANWQMDFWFKLNTTGTTRFRVGAGDSKNTAAASNGIFLRYDTSLTDTTFKFETRAGGTPTTVDTTIAADTAWHHVRIRSTAAGTILMTLYDATGSVQKAESSVACATTCASASLIPHAVIANDGVPASARNFEFDRFSYWEWNLSR